MDPLVCNVAFFGSKEVNWILQFAMLRFFLSKEVSQIPLFMTLRFFWIKVGHLYFPVLNITFFGSKEVS